jgi:hypothetical protein
MGGGKGISTPGFLRAREKWGGRLTCGAGREGLLNCDVEWPPLFGVVRAIRVECGPDVAPAVYPATPSLPFVLSFSYTGVGAGHSHLSDRE